MTQPIRIAPTEADPYPNPPCSGNWLREADGGIRPADDATAATAGLQAPTPATAPAEAPATAKKAKE